MTKVEKKKIVGKAKATAKRPRKKANARPLDLLKATAVKNGKEEFDPKRVTLTTAAIALAWDSIIDDDGIDPGEWAKGFVSAPDDPAMRQRFFQALVAFLNENLPGNKVVADLYSGDDLVRRMRSS